jgi:enoyl-CoA hydratase/carnithine racemase
LRAALRVLIDYRAAMPHEHILTRTEGAVRVVTLARPAKKNAFTSAMYTALAEALADADADSAVRVVLLEGSGGSFTAGNDLGDFMANPPSGEESPVFRFLMQIVDQAKPLVVAVDGPAIGIGTTLLLHADYVVASRDSHLQMPFINLGLSPEGGSSLLLPRIVGQARASEWLMFGEAIDAERAREAGLINAVVAKEELSAFAMARATALASRPAGSVLLAKKLLREPYRAEIKAVIAKEGVHFIERLGSSEAAEAFQAFFTRKR